MCHVPALEIFFALQLTGVGLDLGLPPDLLVLAPGLSQEQGDNTFFSFITNQQAVCCLVHLLPWQVRSPQHSLRNILEYPSASPYLPVSQHGTDTHRHTSCNGCMSLS